MKINYKAILTLSVSLLLYGCNNTSTDTNIPPLQKILTAQQSDYIKKYLSSNLELYHSVQSLQSVNEVEKIYFEKTLTDSLQIFKDEIWELWKNVNTERLNTLPKASSNSQEFTWNIPLEEKMKIKTFTKGAKPANGYPFFINLHGGGGNSNISSAWGWSVNSQEWEAAQSLGKSYNDSPSYYFVPRMSDDRKGRWYYRPQQVTWLRAWQLATLSNEIDPNKTYIMGISEGGYGSFRMGAFYADYFAGMGPMAGPEAKQEVPIENLRNIAVRVEVGEHDTGFGRNVMGLEWKQRLDSAHKASPNGFIHEVNIQPGKGHGIDYNVVSPWLIKHTRNVYPKELSFSYYEIDGAYRLGFGYVRLAQLPHDKYYKKQFYIVKNDNTYHINTKEIQNGAKGKISLYIENVDFTKNIIINLNGKEVYNAKVKHDLGTIIESISTFGDPNRIFSAKVNLEIE